MTKEAKGFWSSTSGVLTGAAGVLTGVVGLLTILVQLDVIGGEGRNAASQRAEREVDPTATTFEAGATTRSPSGARTEAGRSPSQPSFDVDPETLEFAGPLGD